MNFLRLVLTVGLVSTLGVVARAAEVSNQPSVQVTIVMPHLQRFAVTVSGYGSVESDPRVAQALSLPVAGQIVDVEVRNGQAVERGQSLLSFAVAPEARLAYAQAQAELKLARAALGQMQALYRQHLATQAQLDAARKALADAQANLATQRALGGDRAAIELRAPVAAVVENVAAAAGQRVAAGSSLLQLAPLQGRLARIGIEPGAAARLKAGQGAVLVPVFGGATLDGTLLQVASAVDPQTRLVAALISLPAHAGLPLGSALEARIDSGQVRAWAVPRGAVLTDSRGAYLFQVDHGMAHRVDVKMASPGGASVGVDGALNPNWPVVVLGSYELTDGMHVRVEGR